MPQVREKRAGRKTQNMALIALFAVLNGICAWIAIPSGIAAVSRAGTSSGFVPSRRPNSRISHSLENPTDSGKTIETKAWGLKPSVCLMGMPARKKARWKVRMRSRWEMYRARPVLENNRR